MAWIPQDGRYVPFVNMSSPATNSSARNTTTTKMVLPQLTREPHLSFGIPATLMLAVMPKLFSGSIELPTHIIPAGCAWYDTLREEETYFPVSNATFLQCQVYNTSMSATFEYIDGVQNITLTPQRTPEDELLVPAEYVTGPINPTNGGVYDENAAAEQKNASCSTLNMSDKQCIFDAEVLRKLSYQAIVDAFNSLVLGTIGMDTTSLSPGIDLQTNLLDTVLAYSNELAFLQSNEVLPDSTIPSLPDLMDTSDGAEYRGLYSHATSLNHLPLARALEIMFQNITISLLSEKLLQ
jgi:hypothetical protein